MPSSAFLAGTDDQGGGEGKFLEEGKEGGKPPSLVPGRHLATP